MREKGFLGYAELFSHFRFFLQCTRSYLQKMHLPFKTVLSSCFFLTGKGIFLSEQDLQDLYGILKEMSHAICRAYKLNYRDFHHLTGFICKKMPNNILKNVSHLVKPFLLVPKNTHLCNQWPQNLFDSFFAYVSKIRRVLRWFQIRENTWKKVHPEKIFYQNFCKLVG